MWSKHYHLQQENLRTVFKLNRGRLYRKQQFYWSIEPEKECNVCKTASPGPESPGRSSSDYIYKCTCMVQLSLIHMSQFFNYQNHSWYYICTLKWSSKLYCLAVILIDFGSYLLPLTPHLSSVCCGTQRIML